MTWTKFAEEEIAVGRDWTADLDGASIAEEAIAPTSSDDALIVEPIDVDGAVTRYWLRGGRPGSRAVVSISINTSEGEVLSDHVVVSVLR